MNAQIRISLEKSFELPERMLESKKNLDNEDGKYSL